MALYRYEVGQLYHIGRTRGPEAGEYNYRSGALSRRNGICVSWIQEESYG